jgi:heat shock protein HslJ
MKKLLALFLIPLAAAASACAVPPATSNRLAGTQWRLVSIDGAAPVSDRATIGFRTDGISATVGCNGMGGPWHVEGNRLIAGPLMQTEMYCEGPIWGQEQALGAMLVAAPEFTLDGERLLLRSSGHNAELVRDQPQG